MSGQLSILIKAIRALVEQQATSNKLVAAVLEHLISVKTVKKLSAVPKKAYPLPSADSDTGHPNDEAGSSVKNALVMTKVTKASASANKPEPKVVKATKHKFHIETKAMNPTIITTKSKNSLVAKSGNLAEDVLCKSADVLEQLGTHYFKKKIVTCEKLTKKKSDHVLTFDDGTRTTIQLKNGDGGGRGWSFDRRSLSIMPTNESLKELIRIVCLKHSGERKTLPNDKMLISTLLLGDEDDTKPEHFVHTTMKDGKITSLSACPASLFIDTICKDSYENCDAKRTCVHLTPLIYLQRKGGGKVDHSPDDIQAKLRAMPSCMTNITLY